MKEKAVMALVVAAFVIPPWNIACWIIGTCIYYMGGGRKSDSTGENWLYMVPGAPMTLPILAYAKISGRNDF